MKKGLRRFRGSFIHGKVYKWVRNDVRRSVVTESQNDNALWEKLEISDIAYYVVCSTRIESEVSSNMLLVLEVLICLTPI